VLLVQQLLRLKLCIVRREEAGSINTPLWKKRRGCFNFGFPAMLFMIVL
jgi:hypothetical protein